MSLDTLAQEAIARRRGRRGAVSGSQVPSPESALAAIAKYVPVETITLFMFGLSILPESKAIGWFSLKALFVGAIVFTPVCFVLVFIAKYRAESQNKAWPKLGEYPYWRIAAATLAFVVWALALPDTGLTSPELVKVWAFAALAISSVFSLIERVLEP